MRISLSRKLTKSTGYGSFVSQLTQELINNHDVKIVSATEKSDIHLSIISGYKKGSKNVLRIDGVYYDKKRSGMNIPIKKSIKRADGVIFQSKWCKKFVTRMLGVKPKRHAIVYNGVDQKLYNSIVSDNSHPFDKLFISSAHWRINKRPRPIAKAIIRANEQYDGNIGLYIIGNTERSMRVKHPNVKYLGRINKRPELIKFYKMSDYMIHICHIEACPNAVIEGLSCGLPVLCNNISGTPEIVGESGINVVIDKPYNFRYLNNIDDVSSVEVNKVTNGVLKMVNRKWNIHRPDLDISRSADGYYKFFEDILSA